MEPTLIVIEGDGTTRVHDPRAAAANDMHAKYAECTQNVMVSTPYMAGFAVVVWDDNGMLDVRWSRGPNCPIPPCMIPELVKDYVRIGMLTQ